MRYNRKFELNPKQINLIEQALYMYDPNTEDGKEARKLLSYLHHQKNWYRPKNKIYISG
jgi:hypothetical protein